MRWVRSAGLGHAVVQMPEADGPYVVACGRTVSADAEGVEVGTSHERPYGPDTCPDCHGRVKFWTTHPAEVPEGLVLTAAPQSPKARMSAAEREAAIRGLESPTMPEGGAQAPRRLAAVPDDGVLEGDDDVAAPGLPVAGGAVVVPPAPKSRRKSERTAEDASFDKD